MAFTYKILSVFGIDIVLHWSFVLLIVGIFLINPAISFLWLTVFFFVTLHELSHSLVARRYGIKVNRILLVAIGGVSMMDVSNIKPTDEIKMALAGPLFNFVVCLMILGMMFVLNYPLLDWFNAFISAPSTFTLPPLEMLVFFTFWANLLLGSFNLVPAFPMDGGRIFRGLLALRLDYLKATNIARIVSLVIAGFLFIVSAFTLDLWIMVIAFFIAFAAMSEYNSLLVQVYLKKIRLKDLITEDYIILKPNQTVSSAIQKMMARKRFGALVSGKSLKVLSLDDVSQIPRQDWEEKKVSNIAKTVRPSSVNTPADVILQRMNQARRPLLPIVSGKKLVGVVFREDLEKLIRMAEVLRK